MSYVLIFIILCIYRVRRKVYTVHMYAIEYCNINTKKIAFLLQHGHGGGQ